MTESSVPSQQYAPEPMYIMPKSIDDMQVEEWSSKGAKIKGIEWMQVMGKGFLLTESSVPTRRYAPEPMYKKDVHSETQFDECNGGNRPPRPRVEELELQN